jgi:hypothetical protein
MTQRGPLIRWRPCWLSEQPCHQTRMGGRVWRPPGGFVGGPPGVTVGAHENYKTGVVPPPAALERDLIALGVAEKQTGRARQEFERSAEQAGYFEHGKNRLVMPAVAAARETPSDDGKTDRDNTGDGGGGGKQPEIDPIIRGLLARRPKSGDVWPDAERKLWLQLLEGSFKLSIRTRKRPPTEAASHQCTSDPDRRLVFRVRAPSLADIALAIALSAASAQ